MTKHTLHQVLLRAAMRSWEYDTVQHLSGRGMNLLRTRSPLKDTDYSS